MNDLRDAQKIEACREMTMREKIEAITGETDKIITEINKITTDILNEIVVPVPTNKDMCDSEACIAKSSFLPFTLDTLRDQKELLMSIRNKLTDVHRNVCKK